MLLCALRDAFSQAALKNQAAGVHAFVERPNVDNKPTYVLDTETSKPYLQEYIQKDEPPELEVERGEEEQALEAAFRLLVLRVGQQVEEATAAKRLSDKQRAERIKQALSKIRDQLLGLRLIRVEVDDEDDAYIVFETLNTRGKDLELADMVKNHLMRLLGPKTTNVDPAEEKWAEIREEFDQSEARINVNAFLQHSWLSRHPYVAEKKLFKQLRKKVRRAEAKDYLNILRREATLYRQIKEPGARSWKKEQRSLARSLDALAHFGISQPLPLVLSLLRAYDDKRISFKQARTGIWAIEAFHFSHTVVAQKSSSGGMSLLYARFARELLAASKRPDRDKLIREMIASLRERRPSEAEFVEGFSRFRLSDIYTGDRDVVRYILSRHYEKIGRRTVTDLSMMTVEHLASQAGRRPPAEVVASIGNLIFVSEDLNNRLNNKPFKDKQRILGRQTEIWVPDEVTNAKQWGKRAIEARTGKLALEGYQRVWRF